jgi:hypothetical protein
MERPADGFVAALKWPNTFTPGSVEKYRAWVGQADSSRLAGQ